MIHSSKEKAIQNRASKFSQQEIDLQQTPLFFPVGYEKIFIAIYFILLPYLIGLMFQFFYIAERNMELFLDLYDKTMFILTWAIGYEIIAFFLLLYIIKMAVSFSRNNNKGHKNFNENFRRP